MDARICEAIKTKNLIQVAYHWGTRIVEPHAYGINRHGHELLRAYQVSGASDSGSPTGWKLLRVDEIRQISVLSENFSHPRPLYSRGDKALDARIYCEL